jgi:xanthine/uracil/vitamin C permease (AzgA family)
MLSKLSDPSSDLNRNLITATAAVAGFSSFLFGFFTNMPVCLAPGMGLNAYFAYQIVGFHGTGLISYNLALTAVFAEGFIFIFLSLIGMRQWLVKIIPVSLKIAAACGIGLFLAEVGLSANAGIGAIAGSKSTPLDIAGCPDQYKDEFGSCTSHKMTSPTVCPILLPHKTLLIPLADVARYHGWGHLDSLLDDIQGQECHDPGHPTRVNHLMATRYISHILSLQRDW